MIRINYQESDHEDVLQYFFRPTCVWSRCWVCCLTLVSSSKMPQHGGGALIYIRQLRGANSAFNLQKIKRFKLSHFEIDLIAQVGTRGAG